MSLKAHFLLCFCRKLLEKSGQKEEPQEDCDDGTAADKTEKDENTTTKQSSPLQNLPEKPDSENHHPAENEELLNQLSQLKQELEKKQIEMAELKQQEQSKFVSKDQQIDVLNNDLEQHDL